MNIANEYRKIYQREIADPAGDIIYSYTPQFKIYEFKPFSHNCGKCGNIRCTSDCYKELGGLMRKNLVFYCYGESEIVEGFQNGLFSDMEQATMYAYKNRLPKRPEERDGLPGEVLLDLLVQTDEPDAYKLAVRTVFRQDDNNEIKGFDLTCFSMTDGKISLWLGQAKMGAKAYCKQGIHSDLLKFKRDYLSRQIYFIADKPVGLTKEGKAITDAINILNMRSMGKSDDERAKELIRYFKEKNISIKLPCLLAYGADSAYKDIAHVKRYIAKEVKEIQEYFEANQYLFDGLTPTVLFYVFPLRDLRRLRSEEGFYYGLRQRTVKGN